MKPKIIVVGSGLVGYSAALALSRSNLSVTLVTAEDVSTDRSDNRTIGLNDSSARFYSFLDCWSELLTQATPVKKVNISNQGHLGSILISAEDYPDMDALGYVIPSTHIVEVLRQKVLANSAITVCDCTQVKGISQCSDYVTLRLHHNKKSSEMKADWVVAADGAQSRLREWLGIDVKLTQFEHSAFVTDIECDKPNLGIAHERFNKKGVIALLPRGEYQYSLVWCLSSDEASSLTADKNPILIKKLYDYLGYRFGEIKHISTKRSVQSLFASHAVSPSLGRVVLMGNAAHTLHPVAAQGLNLSVRDVAAFAELVNDQLESTGTLDAERIFKNYTDWREKEQAIMTHTTNNVVWLFANDFFPFAWGRQIFTQLIDICPRARRLMSDLMTGRLERMPRSMCGELR